MKHRPVARKWRAQRGVTLVELLTVGVLFTMLLTGIITIQLGVSAEFARGSAKMTADSEASVALQKMSQEIRNGLRAYVEGPTELRVRMPALNSQGDFDRYQSGSLIRYFLMEGSLYRQVDGTPSAVLVSGVSAVAFTTEATPTGLRYQVSLTCRQRSGREYRQTTLSTTLCLRNEPAS